MRAKMMAAATVAAAILLTVPALAQPPTLDSADQALIHSYNPDAMQLYWATVLDTADTEDACNNVVADTTYDYTISPEGEVTVTGAEECTFNLTDVTGPNGQVNHGTVVSNFVQALKDSDYTGSRGCMIKIIAQTDYGKGDDQVKVSETTVTTETTVPTEVTGTTEFTVSETTCGGKPDNPGKSNESHGKSDEIHGQSQGSHGKPENPGKSGDHNPNS